MLLDVYDHAANIGDFEYLNYGLVFGYTHQFLIGTPLPKLALLSRKYREIFKKYGSNQFRLVYSIDKMIIALSGNDTDLIPDDFIESEYLEQATATKNYTSLFYYSTEKTIRNYMFGDPAVAVEAARHGGRVRLWSAACSTGQEPYSIALTLLGLEPNAAGLDIKILATDIDPRVVEEARRGVYARLVEHQMAAVSAATSSASALNTTRRCSPVKLS